MKKILFVNGSYNEIPLIKAAKKLGYFVITSGNDPHGAGHAYGDKYCPCDYSNKEAILEVAQKEKVDAVCSCGNDFGAVSSSYIAEKMNLPGHDSFVNAKIFHEKDEFKKMVEKLNLPSPKSYSFVDLNKALEHVKRCNFPIIVKPVDLGGGKGISICKNLDEGIKGVNDAFKASKIKHVVIEDYIVGEQMAYICFIKNEKVVWSYLTNDYSYLNPYMVWFDARVTKSVADKLIPIMESDVNKVAKSCHVADGFLTIQLMVKDGKPYYLETMRRCLGNYHYYVISKDIGVDMYEWFVANECGLDTSKYIDALVDKSIMSGFMGIYADHNGTIDKIVIDPEFKKICFDSLMLNEKDYVVDDYLHDKLGMVFFTFDNDEQRSYFINKRMSLFKVLYK